MAQSRPAARIEREGRGVNRPTVGRRWRTAFMDVIDLLAVVLSVPLAVLLVGIPIALTLAFLLWLGRAALGAF